MRRALLAVSIGASSGAALAVMVPQRQAARAVDTRHAVSPPDPRAAGLLALGLGSCPKPETLEAAERRIRESGDRAAAMRRHHVERYGAPLPSSDRSEEIAAALEGLPVTLTCAPLPCRGVLELHGVDPEEGQRVIESFRARFPAASIGWEEIARPPAAGVMPFVVPTSVGSEAELTRLRYWLAEATAGYYASLEARGEGAVPGEVRTPGAIPEAVR